MRTDEIGTYGVDSVVWSVGKVRATLSIEYDDWPDLSYYGEWTDKVGEFRGAQWVESIPREYVGRGEYSRFLPANPEYAQQDMARMEAHGDRWIVCTFILRVDVYTLGQWVTAGIASIGGVEWEWSSDGPLVRELMGDLRPEAFAEARATIAAEQRK